MPSIQRSRDAVRVFHRKSLDIFRATAVSIVEDEDDDDDEDDDGDVFLEEARSTYMFTFHV